MSKEKGILFKGEMVRAIMEGRKTQTRRMVKPQPFRVEAGTPFLPPVPNKYGESYSQIKMPWRIGDILYVRETWGVGTRPDPFQGWVDGIEYRADQEYLDGNEMLRINPVEGFDYEKYQGRGWMPSLFMPKMLSRIWLKVTNVRVERLLDISEADAIAEGIISHKGVPGEYPHDTMYKDYLGTSFVHSPIHSYFSLWDSINGAGSHKESQWVWVVEFDVTENPANAGK